MKRIQNLRRMSDDQLQNRLIQIGPEIHRAKVIAEGWLPAPTNDTSLLRRLRKEKARILTILHERKHKRGNS